LFYERNNIFCFGSLLGLWITDYGERKNDDLQHDHFSFHSEPSQPPFFYADDFCNPEEKRGKIDLML
jgi:hypothetical protein